jgi:hypothetical protein
VCAGRRNELSVCLRAGGGYQVRQLLLVVVCALQVRMHSALLLAGEAARSCVRLAFISRKLCDCSCTVDEFEAWC